MRYIIPAIPPSGGWSEGEERTLRENYNKMSMNDLSVLLGRSVCAIRAKKTRMGLVAGARRIDGRVILYTPFTEEDEKILVDWYESHPDALYIDDLAKRMGRTRQLISRKAAEMGLTNANRSRPNGFGEEVSKQKKEWHATHEHPRGFTGKTQSAAGKRRISEASKKRWAEMTPEMMEDVRLKSVNTRLVNGTINPNKNTSSPYSRARGGKREDLGGQYFRSAWEANIARFYNFANIKWEYEPRIFVFGAIHKGCVTYTPDFYLTEKDRWVEVKGWMDDKSKTKLARFKKYYPDEYAKLDIIGEKEYREYQKYSGLIPGWEK